MNASLRRRAHVNSDVPQPHHRPKVPSEILDEAMAALQETTQPLIKVATVIKRNHLLNTLFLRYANAAEHGFRETVTRTDRAAALLGGDRLSLFLRALQSRTRTTGSPSLRRIL